MRKMVWLMLSAVCIAGFLTMGCSSPAKNVKKIALGMTPDEVRDNMGDPYTVRASKIYENGEWMQTWEYMPPPLTWHPKTFWIMFENGKVVQWGEPGDFAGKAGDEVPVSEYSEQKVLR